MKRNQHGFHPGLLTGRQQRARYGRVPYNRRVAAMVRHGRGYQQRTADKLAELFGEPSAKKPAREHTTAARFDEKMRERMKRLGVKINPRLVDEIRPGDRVTILVPAGFGRGGQEWKPKTGRAVMRSSTGGWVLNMGGAHGTPGVADDRNIVKVQKSGKRNPLGLLTGLGDLSNLSTVKQLLGKPRKKMQKKKKKKKKTKRAKRNSTRRRKTTQRRRRTQRVKNFRRRTRTRNVAKPKRKRSTRRRRRTNPRPRHMTIKAPRGLGRKGLQDFRRAIARATGMRTRLVKR